MLNIPALPISPIEHEKLLAEMGGTHWSAIAGDDKPKIRRFEEGVRRVAKMPPRMIDALVSQYLELDDARTLRARDPERHDIEYVRKSEDVAVLTRYLFPAMITSIERDRKAERMAPWFGVLPVSIAFQRNGVWDASPHGLILIPCRFPLIMTPTFDALSEYRYCRIVKCIRDQLSSIGGHMHPTRRRPDFDNSRRVAGPPCEITLTLPSP